MHFFLYKYIIAIYLHKIKFYLLAFILLLKNQRLVAVLEYLNFHITSNFDKYEDIRNSEAILLCDHDLTGEFRIYYEVSLRPDVT